MNSDSDFAEAIGKLLDEVQNGAASAKIVFDQRGQNVGTQTNIGNVHGSLNIGTK
jgi:hypothetical protein